jgi:hypothetical protein
VVLDSRHARVLDGDRSMIGEEEFAWAAEHLGGDLDHVLVGTSLPWLLPPAIHDIEIWNERLCEHPRRWLAQSGEWLRRAADLEHWAAFRTSFERLAGLLCEVSSTRDGTPAPASVCVLSGDVHHGYICRARFAGPPAAPVYQLTCSPLHNRVPTAMRLAFRAAWTRPVERIVRWLLARVARIPRASLDWQRLDGPLFGNAISTLQIEERRIRVTVEMIERVKGVDHTSQSVPPTLGPVVSRQLAD